MKIDHISRLISQWTEVLRLIKCDSASFDIGRCYSQKMKKVFKWKVITWRHATQCEPLFLLKLNQNVKTWRNTMYRNVAGKLKILKWNCFNATHRRCKLNESIDLKCDNATQRDTKWRKKHCSMFRARLKPLNVAVTTRRFAVGFWIKL